MDMASTVFVSDNPKDMEAAIAHMFQQIDEIREQMKADDVEIAQIRSERAVLRAEAQALRDETEGILASVRSTLRA